MAKYTGNLTDKQKEMLEPLEKEVKDLMREKERNRKLRAFKQSMGFEENKETRQKIEYIDERYIELSKQISEIYNAQSEMMQHMRNAIEEVKKVDWYCDKYGFVVEGLK